MEILLLLFSQKMASHLKTDTNGLQEYIFLSNFTKQNFEIQLYMTISDSGHL